MSNKTAEDYFNEGLNFKKIKKYTQAIDAFKQVLITNPDVYQVFFNLGNIYHEQKKYGLAIENFKKASKINSND